MRQAIAGILVQGDQILIGKKVIKEGHFLSGGWHLPGGYLERNETEQEAVVREFKEETNLDVEVIKKIVSFNIPHADVCVNWYLLSAASQNIKAGDDLSEVKFVPKTEVIRLCDERAVKFWPDSVKHFLLT